jgi:septum formation inhibitor MinC
MGVLKCFTETILGIAIGTFLLLVVVQFSLLVSNKDASKLDVISQKVHQVLSSVKNAFSNPKIMLSENVETSVSNVKNEEPKQIVEEKKVEESIPTKEIEIEKVENQKNEKVGNAQKLETPKEDLQTTKTEKKEVELEKTFKTI